MCLKLRSIKRPNGVTKSRFGWPKVFSDHNKRRIIMYALLNLRLIYIELAMEAQVLCNQSTTLYWTLKNYGLTNSLAKKRHLLTPKVAKK